MHRANIARAASVRQIPAVKAAITLNNYKCVVIEKQQLFEFNEPGTQSLSRKAWVTVGSCSKKTVANVELFLCIKVSFNTVSVDRLVSPKAAL